MQAQPDYEPILEASISKRYPRTRLQRLLLCAYLGIDAGSTTTKLALIAPDGGLHSTYNHSNQGNPESIVKEQLKKIYQLCGDRITIRGSAGTGYGEEISEAACMFLLPFFLRRLGVRKVILIAVIAWSVRFLLLSLGDTGHGLWLLIASGLVYGVAFDFFNIAGNVYVDRQADASVRASALGLFMAISSGFGGTIGLVAAQKLSNTLVFSQPTPEARYGGWVDFWLIFAVYALVIALLFYIWMKCSSGSGASKLSKNRSTSSSVTR